MIAKQSNKTATPSWPEPHVDGKFYLCPERIVIGGRISDEVFNSRGVFAIIFSDSRYIRQLEFDVA